MLSASLHIYITKHHLGPSIPFHGGRFDIRDIKLHLRTVYLYKYLIILSYPCFHVAYVSILFPKSAISARFIT